MSTYIFCKTSTKGVHSFYLHTEGQTYYLFSQNFRRGVKHFFESGVTLNESMNFKKAKGDAAIIHTMEKLPCAIRYIEREYELEILTKTIRKNSKNPKKAA